MNYKNIYHTIIENRIKNPYLGYTENHHILPRSLGGSNCKSNLVRLNAREHFICHLLLTKMYDFDTIEGKKMVKAFAMMLWCKGELQQRYVTSRQFQKLREKFAIVQSLQINEKNSQYGTAWVHNDITREIKKVKVGEILSDDWVKGRSLDLDKQEIERENIKKQSRMVTFSKKELFIKQLHEYHEIYKTVEFKEFVRITGYDKSQPNISMRFSKYVKDFIPQMGKKRG